MAIYNVKNITLITNSFNIADILMKKQRHGDFTGKIIFIGGVVDSENSKTNGEITLSALNRFMTDKTFISVTSISPKGIMMWDESEGEFSASLSKNSSEIYVVANSTKFDTQSFYKFLDFKQVNHIITDDENEISEITKSAIDLGNATLHIVKSK
jgi:DeoR/GlpR family transcriptional regulator of sugar metabolism